jgi:hypothetical protein
VRTCKGAQIEVHEAVDVTATLTELTGWVESKAAWYNSTEFDEDWVQQLIKIAECAQCFVNLIHFPAPTLIHKWVLFTYGVNIMECLAAVVAQVRGGTAESRAATASTKRLTEAIDAYVAMASQESGAHMFPHFCGHVLEQARKVCLDCTERQVESRKKEIEDALANIQAIIGGLTAGSSSRHELPADTSVFTWEALTARAGELLLALQAREVGANHGEVCKVAL